MPYKVQSSTLETEWQITPHNCAVVETIHAINALRLAHRCKSRVIVV